MVTPKLLMTAKDALRGSYLRSYPAMLKELEAFLDDHIAALARGEAAAVIVRPQGDDWEVGPEGGSRCYSHAPAALRAVHALLAGARQLQAAEYVKPGALRPANAIRNGIREQVPLWAESIACPALALAVKHMRVSKAGVVTYEPPIAGLPRFITA